MSFIWLESFRIYCHSFLWPWIWLILVYRQHTHKKTVCSVAGGVLEMLIKTAGWECCSSFICSQWLLWSLHRNRRDLQPNFGWILRHTHTHVHKHTLTSKEDKQACYSHYEVLRSKTDWVSRQRRLVGKGDWLGVFMVIRE